jgi:hypothetical protein
MLPVDEIPKTASEVKVTCGVCGKEVILKQIDGHTSYYKEICECKCEWILQRLR